ncbi:unnamed protein product [Caenorhabditis angaria]|uniref:DOMON domain-containing protein n=1 Tax=Caenorhabditis angaria TaxID=860376 RepID=A0A9P1J2S8_9PELO|nr:unnamed protein product [Caenorhabditis angaria]
MTRFTIFAAVFVLLSFVAVSDAVPCTFITPGQQITYGVRDGLVHFRVVLTGISPNTSGWTAIGFGNSMFSGLDTIVIRVLNGRVYVTDEYVRGFTSPTPDRTNNVQVYGTRYENGVVVASFSRSIFSTEASDANLSGCSPWKFSTGLNRMSGQGHLFHHSQTPVHRQVCIQQCTV